MKGTIYKLVCGDEYYFGSTTTYLKKRLWGHKSDAKRLPDSRLYSRIDMNTATIEVIEECIVENIRQLRQIEDKYIKEFAHDPLCLNSFNAFRTEEEAREYSRVYAANYKLNHADHIREVAKARYTKSKSEK